MADTKAGLAGSPGAGVPPMAQELVEVKQAMVSAQEVFARIKTEKMESEPPLDVSTDPSLQGVPKEIYDKAQKQKGRERANRASAAASRNKVMRYQTELESRLNRVEAERNALRGENSTSDLALARNFLLKLRSANPSFVAGIIPLHTLDAFLGATERAVTTEGAAGQSPGMGFPGSNLSPEAMVLSAQGHSVDAAVAGATVTGPGPGTVHGIPPPSEQEHKMQMEAAVAAANAAVATADQMAPAPKKTRRA